MSNQPTAAPKRPVGQSTAILPTDAAARYRIRTGTDDNWKAGYYKESESGGYDPTSDPTRRTPDKPVEGPSSEGKLDFHERISNRTSQIDAMGEDASRFAMETAWRDEQSRQSAAYNSIYQEAQSLGGSPYYSNGQAYINTLNIGDNGKIRNTIIQSALSLQGSAYSWGGGGAGGASTGVNWNGRSGVGIVGFDCSGLVQYAYARAGLSLPRTSSQQSTIGRVAPISSLRPGDLVAWGRPGNTSHVAVYLGNGMIMEAATGRRAGTRKLGSAYDRQAFGVAMSYG